MDMKKLSEDFDKFLKEESESGRLEAWFNAQPKDERPKGWVSIEDHLPYCDAGDFITQGYSLFKVRDKDGKESMSGVTDHNIWYYKAKDAGITEWFNP